MLENNQDDPANVSSAHGHSHSHDDALDEEDDLRTDEEKMEARKNELKKKYCWTSLGHFDLEDPVRL